MAKKLSNKERLELVKNEILEIADKLGVPPRLLTVGQILNNTDKITSWDIREVGGLTHLKKLHLNRDDSLDLAELQRGKNVQSYITSLEKRIGQEELLFETIASKLEEIEPIKLKSPYKASRKKVETKREVNAALSDMHYGALIKPEEINDVNSYSWVEASRRTAYYIKNIIDYKPNKRHEVEQLNLFINGDILQGIIHDRNYRNHDLLIHQVNGTLHILTHAIANLASNYKKVNVVCTPGNHGNAIHKREGGNRVIVETYDSYANMVYYALSASFRDTKNVEFKVPKTHYAFHDSIGGRMMITHGDVQFSRALGNPGTSLNVKSLSDAITRFNAGEVAAGRKPVDLIMFGHVHFYSDFYTPCGVRVVTNPSLSGTDGFAHSLGINNSTSAQVLFESTKDYILGDSRLVQSWHIAKCKITI